MDNKKDSFTVSLSTLARVAQDAMIILAICSIFFGPLWYFNVQKPISDLSVRVDKLEKGQIEAGEKLNVIDKNVAVILEKISGMQERIKK